MTDQQSTISELQEEIARLKAQLEPQWFYGEDQEEYCLHSPSEVIEFEWDNEKLEFGHSVLTVACATPVASIYCAVHCLTDDEMEERGTDKRFTFTEHATFEEAERFATAGKGIES